MKLNWKRKFAFLPVHCDNCGYFVWLENLWKVGEKVAQASTKIKVCGSCYSEISLAIQRVSEELKASQTPISEQRGQGPPTV